MTAPDPQPPAAPETDVSARLTEGERRILTAHFWGRRITANATHLADLIAPAVERIVAERVRVVEGERDAANVHAIECERIGVEAIEARIMATSRAESAEAAHEALRAGVEALAGRWKDEADAGRNLNGHPLLVQCYDGHADDLRALLGGDAR